MTLVFKFWVPLLQDHRSQPVQPLPQWKFRTMMVHENIIDCEYA